MTFQAAGFLDRFDDATPSGWLHPHAHPYRRISPSSSHHPDPLELVRLATEMKSRAGLNDPGTIPAGYSYWAQFLAHDLTLSVPGAEGDDPRARNARSGQLDLECLLGHGPRVDAHLYAAVGAPVLVLDERHAEYDVPRRSDGTAILADARNDDNVLVGQVHLALARAYNRLVRQMHSADGNRLSSYARARRVLTAVYQRVTVIDFLARITRTASAAQVEALRVGLAKSPPASSARTPTALPIEFITSAMRFGHSMARSEYTLNADHAAPLPLFPRRTVSPADTHLRGSSPLPRLWTVDWDRFFDDRSSAHCQMGHAINASITPAMGKVAMGNGEKLSLALMTLGAEAMFGIAAPKDVAAKLQVTISPALAKEPSLWRAVLLEAEEQADGRLGALGSALVLQGFESALAGASWAVESDASEPEALLAAVESVPALLRWGSEPRTSPRTVRGESPAAREGHAEN